MAPYKYLRVTVKKTVNQLYIYSTELGAAIKCKEYSEITVESGTHVKIVKITLNIFAVQISLCMHIHKYVCTRKFYTKEIKLQEK